MASETIIDSLLATKLHRPPIGENHIHRPHLLERLDQHRNRPLTLVSAPAGYGKSLLISSWLELLDIPSAWVSLDENDNDFRTFTAYLIAAVETLFPGACRKTRTLLNAPELPPMSVLINGLLNELDRIEHAYVIVLDDFYIIKETVVHDLLAAILKHPPRSLHLVIAGRRDPPLPISALRAQSLVTEIRTQDLRFTTAETGMFLKQLLGIQVDPSTAAALEKKTEGWVTGLRLAALSMRHRGNLDPKLLEPQTDAQYVMEFLFYEVFSHQPPEISQYLLATAILDRFCGPLCEAVCVPGAEPFTCEVGGWEFIAWLKKENLFLISLDPENRWFRYHHLFQKLLVNQLNRRCSVEEIKALHGQASAWFVENGLIEEGLQHSLAGNDIPEAMQIVARYGHDLMNNQQWPRLERWLNMLPGDQTEQDPELLLLEGWLHHIRHDWSNQMRCLKMIEALDASSPPDTLPETLIRAKHIQGQLDAMRGIKHYIAADGEAALLHLRRACENIPLHYKRVRVFAHIFQLGAYQMVGELATGLPIYQEEMRDCCSRDQSYHSTYLTNLCFIYWMDADLIAMRQTVDVALIAGKHHQLPDTAPYALYFQGIYHYHRNELKFAEEKLTNVVKAHRIKSPVNYAHSAFALALTFQAQKKLAKTREISEELIAHAVDNNNADMLQVARAFAAELALRQGRLAEASRWVKKYHAKPFLPTYRFYMPQLAAVKILLAQDTTDSRRRAADLLDQLHDFLVSIHNNRFRIDALALQALLHDARGDDTAAVEKLSQALDLAEPSGFIRLFVDLGLPMADLLKQLIQQNIAVDYAGQILSAFNEDAQRVVPGAFHHDQSLDHHISLSSSNSAFPPGHRPLWAGGRIPPSAFPLPPSRTSQPLAEPMTNRELEILNLLGQRLQNKEIAAKLFISPQTVKKHLNNIYVKLTVSSRRQAVEKAGALGILT